MSIRKLLLLGTAGLALVGLVGSCGVTTVDGNERAVVQNWQDGVLEEIWVDRTHFYNRFTTTPYIYHIGTEKFIMGRSNLYNGEGHDYVDYPAFSVTTGGSGKEQPATFSVTLQYHIDPTKLIALHNSAKHNYEDLVIKPQLTRIISDQATQLEVLQFYSGNGRVALQKSIEEAISNSPKLSAVGIVVETFVIDAIDLDEKYVAEITGRQLATQKKLRAIEEAKAAQENAKKVEAEAQADKLKRIVEAEAAKAERVKAAEAQASEVKLAAEADRFRKEENAKGLLAQGMAEARVEEAKRNAKYSGEAGKRRAQVEIEKARVGLFQNMQISGVLPERTVLTIINSGQSAEGGSTGGPVLSIPATATSEGNQ